MAEDGFKSNIKYEEWIYDLNNQRSHSIYDEPRK